MTIQTLYSNAISSHNPSAATIRAARAALGLTQAEAAALCLVSTRAWIKWESGERPISAPAWALFRLRSEIVTLRGIEQESQK